MMLALLAAPIEWQAGFEVDMVQEYEHTSDVTEDDLREFVAMSIRLEARPIDLAACWMSESQLRTHAHNPNGNAVGIFQVMPVILKGLGYPGTWADFYRLSFRDQLVWAEKYYQPHTGKLTSAGACYLSTFLPAYLSRADTPSFVLCSSTRHPEWYFPNRRAFDPSGKGRITVEDLQSRIDRETHGPRWEEFAARIGAAVRAADTDPAIPAVVMRGDGETGEG